MKKRDPFEKLFPHVGARAAADAAAEEAWTREPGIALVRVCQIWNDAYAALALHSGAGRS